MTFKTWINRNYINEDSPKGDLARDIHTDETFPKNGLGKFDGWRRLIVNHLEHHGACDGCLAAFDECWKEYELCERKRLKRPLPKQ